MASVNAAELLKKANASKAAASGKPKPTSYSLEEDLPPKVMIYGPQSAGKTFFLMGPLLLGDKVFVVSTDFGSNGLITIKNELTRIGRRELMKNIRGIDFNDYEHVYNFFGDPAAYVPDFWDFAPTMLAWEGFSNFNGNVLDEYILAHAPGAANAGELRQAGFTHTTQDWQGMQRGTMRPLGRFLALQNSTNTLAKLLTCHERGTIDVNELNNNKAEKTVLVQGGARKLMSGGFDVIMVAFAKENKDGVIDYFYRCKGDTEKYNVKSRGYDLKPIEPAKPEHVWGIIKATGGGFAEGLK